jgi:hypothetical protein
MSAEPMSAENVEIEPEEASTNLPSDQEVKEEEVNPYDISKFKDENGKIVGKFETAEDLMKSFEEAQKYIKEVQDEKAKQGNQQKQQEQKAEIEQTRKQLEDAIRAEVTSDVVSDDTISKAKELGMTDAEIKVIEYETKEALNKIVEHVGSMETYNHMIETLSQNLSQEEKSQFNEMINSKAGAEIALLGLQAKYQQLTGQNVSKDRLRGNVARPSNQGYTSQQEMLRDLRYIQTTGRNDKAAIAAYEAKKRVTPDHVVYGR